MHRQNHKIIKTLGLAQIGGGGAGRGTMAIAGPGGARPESAPVPGGAGPSGARPEAAARLR
jgi:hypothetical protein